MLLTLNIAPGVCFHATSASVGLSDAAVEAMKGSLVVDHGTDFVWQQVRAASDRLFHTEPQGRC